MRTFRIHGKPRYNRSPNGAKAKLPPRYSRGEIAILPLKIPIAQGKHLKMRSRIFKCNGHMPTIVSKLLLFIKCRFKRQNRELLHLKNDRCVPSEVKEILDAALDRLDVNKDKIPFGTHCLKKTHCLSFFCFSF